MLVVATLALQSAFAIAFASALKKPADGLAGAGLRRQAHGQGACIGPLGRRGVESRVRPVGPAQPGVDGSAGVSHS